MGHTAGFVVIPHCLPLVLAKSGRRICRSGVGPGVAVGFGTAARSASSRLCQVPPRLIPSIGKPSACLFPHGEQPFQHFLRVLHCHREFPAPVGGAVLPQDFPFTGIHHGLGRAGAGLQYQNIHTFHRPIHLFCLYYSYTRKSHPWQLCKKRQKSFHFPGCSPIIQIECFPRCGKNPTKRELFQCRSMKSASTALGSWAAAWPKI